MSHIIVMILIIIIRRCIQKLHWVDRVEASLAPRGVGCGRGSPFPQREVWGGSKINN